MKARLFAAVLAVAVPAAVSAQAHAVLLSADPAPRAMVRTAPTALRLQFSNPVLPKFTTLSVTAPDGRLLHVGPVAVDPQDKRVITAPLHGAGARGVYLLRWTAATSDMHKLTGSYTFALRP